MSRRLSWKPTAAIALCGGALVAGTAGLAALGAQTGPLMWSPLFGFDKSHDQKAFHILDRDHSPAALDAAKAEIDRALVLSPYDNAARLRLVYIDSIRHPGLSHEGQVLFAQSYELTPYDYTVAAWRIQFGLEHWGALTPDLRRAIYAEAMAFGRSHSADVNIPRVLQSIRDPQGRLAAALWLRALNH